MFTTGPSQRGVTIITAQDVHELGPSVIAERTAAIVGDAPAYLSFDIDALDPAFAPGTETPEIGGLASWQMRAILRRLGSLHFVGMDVVEVAPPYDVAEITALAAATVVWEYLALVSFGQGAERSANRKPTARRSGILSRVIGSMSTMLMRGKFPRTDHVHNDTTRPRRTQTTPFRSIRLKDKRAVTARSLGDP